MAFWNIVYTILNPFEITPTEEKRKRNNRKKRRSKKWNFPSRAQTAWKSDCSSLPWLMGEMPPSRGDGSRTHEMRAVIPHLGASKPEVSTFSCGQLQGRRPPGSARNPRSGLRYSPFPSHLVAEEGSRQAGSKGLEAWCRPDLRLSFQCAHSPNHSGGCRQHGLPRKNRRSEKTQVTAEGIWEIEPFALII